MLADGWDCLLHATRAAEPSSVSRKGTAAAHESVGRSVACVIDAVGSLCSRAVSCVDNLASGLPSGHFAAADATSGGARCVSLWVALARLMQTQPLVDPEGLVETSAVTSALWTLLRRADSVAIVPARQHFVRFAALLDGEATDDETRLHSAGILCTLACRLGAEAGDAPAAASVEASAAIVLKALASIGTLAAAVAGGGGQLYPSPSTTLVVSEVLMGAFDIYGTPHALHEAAFRRHAVVDAMEAALRPLAVLFEHFEKRCGSFAQDEDGDFLDGTTVDEVEQTESAAERLQDVVSNMAPFVAFKRGQQQAS